MENKATLKKLAFFGSFAIYIPVALLMYCFTKYLIPYLSETTGQETTPFWFIVARLGIFTPLIVTAILLLKWEGFRISKSKWTERLRFKII